MEGRTTLRTETSKGAYQDRFSIGAGGRSDGIRTVKGTGCQGVRRSQAAGEVDTGHEIAVVHNGLVHALDLFFSQGHASARLDPQFLGGLGRERRGQIQCQSGFLGRCSSLDMGDLDRPIAERHPATGKHQEGSSVEEDSVSRAEAVGFLLRGSVGEQVAGQRGVLVLNMGHGIWVQSGPSGRCVSDARR